MDNKNKINSISKDLSHCQVHLASTSLNLYGHPSYELLKHLLGSSFITFLKSSIPDQHYFYPIVPEIDLNMKDNMKTSIDICIHLRPHNNYIQASNFGSSLMNNGMIHQDPIHTIFKIYDEESYLQLYMIIPELSHQLKTDIDKTEYINRLNQWINLGIHPNITQAYMIKQIFDGKTYIFTETYELITLRDWINEGCGYIYEDFPYESSRKLLNVLIQICFGIEHLHANNLVHNDLRPENIYIDKEINIKIGNIFLFSPRKFAILPGKSPFVGGCPEYWSPEQAYIFQVLISQGKNQSSFVLTYNNLLNISEKVDIYALGLIILEIMEGKRIWLRGDKIKSIYEKWIDQNFHNIHEKDLFGAKRFLPQIIKGLRKLIINCLNERPDERPGILQIIKELIESYNKTFTNPKELLWQKFYDKNEYICESLNNKAISSYYMGKIQDSYIFWDEAITHNSQHILVIYNYGLAKAIRNEYPYDRIIHDLNLTPETSLRNYLLTMLHVKSGKFRGKPSCLEYELMQALLALNNYMMDNLALLPQDSMRFKLGMIIDRFKNKMLGNINEIYEFYQYPICDVQCITFNQGLFASISIRKKHMALNLCHINHMKYGETSELIFDLQYNNDNQLLAPSTIIIDSNQQYVAYSIGIIAYIFHYNIQNKDINHIGNLIGHTKLIKCMGFNKKFNQISTSALDNTTKIWNIQYFECVLTIQHNTTIIYIEFTSNDKNLYGFGEDGSIYIWTLSTKELQTKCIQKPPSSISALVIHYQLQVMITASTANFALFVWNIETNQSIMKLEGHNNLCNGLQISDKNNILLSSSIDGTVRIWNLITGNCLLTLGDYGPIILARFTNDDDFDNIITILDENYHIRQVNYCIKAELNGNELSELIKPNELFLDMNYKTYKDLLYKSALREFIQEFNNLNIKNYNIIQYEHLFRMGENTKFNVNIYEKQEIKRLLLELNMIKFNQNQLSIVNHYMEDYIFSKSNKENHVTYFCCAIEKNKRNYLCVADSQAKIMIYRLNYHDVYKVFTSNSKSRISSLSFSNDNQYLIETNQTNESNYSVRIWSINDGNTVVEHNYHRSKINTAKIDKANKFIISCGLDSKLIIYDIHTRNISLNQLKKMSINEGYSFTDMILYENDQYAFTSSTDHKIRSWDIPKKCRLKVFNGHSSVITTLYYDDTSKKLISASHDGTIRIWNIEYNRCEKVIKLKNPYIKHIDIIDMNKLVILAFHNGHIALLDLNTEKIKWHIQLFEEIIGVYWFRYPSKIVIITTTYIKIFCLFWKYI